MDSSWITDDPIGIDLQLSEQIKGFWNNLLFSIVSPGCHHSNSSKV